MRCVLYVVAILAILFIASPTLAEDKPDWRPLPLINKEGKIHEDWGHTGYGSFVVDEGALRTECDEKGMGLLVYKKEKFGDCRIRVVYRAKDAKSNAGVYIRINDGILDTLGKAPPAVKRDAGGKLSDEEINKLKEASEKELGPWYAVHHGYEVQICDAGDALHGTGAIYSLAKTAGAPKTEAGAWRTLIITLKGDRVEVELDGKAMSSFDSADPNISKERIWHEPKREPQRPRAGYIGLQNHDPGDVVYFKEVSVQSLAGP